MAIRVLIVEDSPLMQRLMSALIEDCPDLKIVGIARDPFEARSMIKETHPDVLTLDVEMPRMNGIEFLEKLMRLRPMPAVMVSSLTEANAGITLEALALGAVDFVTKPRAGDGGEFDSFGQELCEKLIAAGTAHLRSRRRGDAPARPQPAGIPTSFNPEGVIAVGASTGGTEAIKDLLADLPVNTPPILIVQHMPETFTRLFAKNLNGGCALKVTEAANGTRLRPGHAYVAPGGQHLTVKRLGGGLLCHLNDREAVNRHRPSVDVLFDSVAAAAGARAVGVLLTGMGRDGASGLGAMKRAGAFTICQDEESCVVFGMPKVAIDMGHADCVLPLASIAPRMLAALADTAESS